ncbi:MAG: DUF3299 domain-containing protein [Pseudomonadales bacterium]|jgi:hypothetical protein|nr:DUF3299 domain-containing protein [Pseudomonadales bacterium]
MNPRSFALALALLLPCLPAGTVAEESVPAAETPRVIDWAALMPPDWSPPDADPSRFFHDPDTAAMNQPPDAPLVKDMDGALVILEGWLVPLEWDVERFHEFLLVPYFGACIHVPPPPPNQIVHVVLAAGLDEEALYEPQRLTGRLSTQGVASDLAVAGYRMLDARAELAQW